MNVLISGGCKNGKSWYAQRRAKEMSEQQCKPLYYIATMIPRDEEDAARISRHVAERRGWGFETIEQGKDLTAILKASQVDLSGVFLLDSVTALLDNEMFDGTGNLDETAAGRVREDLVRFAQETGNTVFVSDYIYGDAGCYTAATEDYRRSLAEIDRTLAARCDQVIQVSFGIQERWK